MRVVGVEAASAEKSCMPAGASLVSILLVWSMLASEAVELAEPRVARRGCGASSCALLLFSVGVLAPARLTPAREEAVNEGGAAGPTVETETAGLVGATEAEEAAEVAVAAAEADADLRRADCRLCCCSLSPLSRPKGGGDVSSSADADAGHIFASVGCCTIIFSSPDGGKRKRVERES